MFYTAHDESTFALCFYVAGVASGATRAALTQHFSLENNAADISAKVSCLILLV